MVSNKFISILYPWFCVDTLLAPNVLQWPSGGETELMSFARRKQTEGDTIRDCSYWLHTFSTLCVFQIAIAKDKL